MIGVVEVGLVATVMVVGLEQVEWWMEAGVVVVVVVVAEEVV